MLALKLNEFKIQVIQRDIIDASSSQHRMLSAMIVRLEKSNMGSKQSPELFRPTGSTEDYRGRSELN